MLFKMSSGKICPLLDAPGDTKVSWLFTSIARKLSILQHLVIIADFSSRSAHLNTGFVTLLDSACKSGRPAFSQEKF